MILGGRITKTNGVANLARTIIVPPTTRSRLCRLLLVRGIGVHGSTSGATPATDGKLTEQTAVQASTEEVDGAAELEEAEDHIENCESE